MTESNYDHHRSAVASIPYWGQYSDKTTVAELDEYIDAVGDLYPEWRTEHTNGDAGKISNVTWGYDYIRRVNDKVSFDISEKGFLDTEGGYAICDYLIHRIELEQSEKDEAETNKEELEGMTEDKIIYTVQVWDGGERHTPASCHFKKQEAYNERDRVIAAYRTKNPRSNARDDSIAMVTRDIVNGNDILREWKKFTPFQKLVIEEVTGRPVG